MKNKYGLHLGGSQEGLTSLVKDSVDLGAEFIQTFLCDPRGYLLPKPDPSFVQIIKEVPVVVHSPYWVSCFNPRVRKHALAFIKHLDSKFSSKEHPLRYVMHTGNPPKEMGLEEVVENVVSFMRSIYLEVRPQNTTVLIENSALPLSTYNITLKALETVKEQVPQTGLCLDTEHAYAAGEDITNISWENYYLVHMNAIPRYVRQGEGLDRHSWTSLKAGKPIIYDCIDSLKPHPGKWILTERMDPTISLVDLIDLKSRLED